MLQLNEVEARYGSFKALEKVSMTVGEGELVVLLGANGAGKTTVLDLICGRTRATSGNVAFKGADLLKMREDQIVHAGVGRKFQTPSVYEDLSVFANLELSFPKGHGVFGALFFKRDDAVKARIEEIAELIGLTEELTRLSGELSHGQKQWLEIGMLLAQDPRLLLVDEPAAGMTPAEREKTTTMLVEAARKHAVVVVEHDMEFVRRLNCKVTVLNEGSVLAEGSLDHVTNNKEVIDVYLGR